MKKTFNSHERYMAFMGLGFSHSQSTALVFTRAIEKERDTYRDLCSELVDLTKAMFSTTNLVEHVKAKSKLDLCIEKSEKILGEKNGAAN